MPALEDIVFTLGQSAEQERLKVVSIGYAYTLDRSDDMNDLITFSGNIDILGDDVVVDDKLALHVDEHPVRCAGGARARVERSVIVGQSLLDEDIATDEIKLRIKVVSSNGDEFTAMTPIIRGDF